MRVQAGKRIASPDSLNALSPCLCQHLLHRAHTCEAGGALGAQRSAELPCGLADASHCSLVSS